MKYSAICFAIVFLFFTSCKTHITEIERKIVSVSLLPQKYFVKAISGDSVNINVMIPPGASHSSYEPTPRQMNLLSKSQAYFESGHLDFEFAWMSRFEGANPNMKVYDVSKGIELISGSQSHNHETSHKHDQTGETGTDPHMWMSPKNVKIIASNILNSLSELYPSDTGFFLENYKTFLAEVDSIDNLFSRDSSQLKGLNFIIYHPALGYLARDYGMEQIVLQFEGKEPPPAHIKEIIDISREKNIRTVFVQKQFSIDNSRSLAKEINAEIIPIDPMDEDWKEQMITIHDYLLPGEKTKR